MYLQDASSLAEAYDSLFDNFISSNVYAFCQAAWLLPEGKALSTNTLDRMIYAEGDKHEIYSAQERRIIQSIKGLVFSCCYQLHTKTGVIDTRLIAIEIEPGYDPIYYSVALMKIINKAYDGFNVFMFVSRMGVFLGYAELEKGISFNDCVLSTPICEAINWELLSEVFLNRDETDRFIDFYSGIAATIGSVRYCYYSETEKESYQDHFDYDHDYFEETHTLDLEAYFGAYSPQEPDEDEFSKRITQFDNEVYCCNEELAFIEKVHVNPLELLFEAEAALALSEKQAEYSDDTRSDSSDDTTPDTEFVDDPIELMKKLKKKRGGA